MTAELSVFEKDFGQELQLAEALPLGEAIQKFDEANKLQCNLAYGRLWNSCTRGTRQELCENLNLKYDFLATCGRTATKFPISVPIPKNVFWKHLVILTKQLDDPDPEWLTRISEGNWSTRHLENETREHIRRRMPKYEPKYEPKAEPKEAPKRYSHVVKQQVLTISRVGMLERREALFSPDLLDRIVREKAALEVFGIFGVPFSCAISKESITILYRGLAKKIHSDKNAGSDQAMKELNAAEDILLLNIAEII